jgi:hypothetical protein
MSDKSQIQVRLLPQCKPQPLAVLSPPPLRACKRLVFRWTSLNVRNSWQLDCVCLLIRTLHPSLARVVCY